VTRYLFLVGAAATASSLLAQVPAKLSASIDNWTSHKYTIELQDGKLLYSDATPKSSPDSIIVVPSAEQWRIFRRALDTIPVWAWREKYWPSEPVFDGTAWSFSVAYADRSLTSSGGNCYPDAHGAVGPIVLRTAAFVRLEAAIETLLGGKAFRSEQEPEQPMRPNQTLQPAPSRLVSSLSHD
jgi:hypothetical protein